MLHQLRSAAPDVDFRAVNDRASCKYMKMITPAALLRCLVEGADEVHVDAETAALARAQRAADDRDRPARRRRMTHLRRAGLAAARRRRRHRHRCRRSGRRAGRAPRPAAAWSCSAKRTASPVRPPRTTPRAGSPWCCRDTDDSVDAHVADTLAAGAGLCDPDAVTLDRRRRLPGGHRIGQRRAHVSTNPRRAVGAEPRGRTLPATHRARRRRRHRRRGATRARPRGGHAGHPDQTRRAAICCTTAGVGDRCAGRQSTTGIGVIHAPSVILATGGLGPSVQRDHQPRGLDRRRDRAGAVGRRRGQRHRVHPVPSDDAVRRRRRPRPATSPAGHRGDARRGRGSG